MNIYKLITFVIILNLVYGSAVTLGDYQSGNTEYSNLITQVDNNIDTQAETESEMNQDDSKVATTELQLTTGSGIKWSRIIKNTLINSLNPISITPSLYSATLDRTIAYLLLLFRTMIGTFLVIKLYDKIKNKQGD